MISIIALSLVPVSLLHFILCLARRVKTSWFWVQLKFGYPLSVLFVSAIIGDLIHGYVLFVVLLPYTITFVISVLIVLIQSLAERRPRLERHQIVYVLTGSVVALIGGATDLLARLSVPVPRLGNLSVLLYAIIIAVAIVRHRLLDMSIVVGRVIVLFVFAFLLWSLFGLMGAWWAGTAYHSFFPVVVATVLLLIFYEPLKLLIERQTDIVFQRQSFEFQKELTKLSHELAQLIPLEDLVSRIGSALYRSAKIERFAIYVCTRSGDDYRLIKSRGVNDSRMRIISRNRLFTRFLSNHRVEIDVDEIETELALWHPSERQKELVAVARTLSWLRVHLIVPFIFQTELIGFLALSARDSETRFSEREKELLLTIGNQIALSVVNLLSHEQMAQSERLAALGEMAAALAHEIKNPLGVIKASAQILVTNANDEFKEILDIVVDEVNRLDRVVARFLDFARPIDGTFQQINISTLAEKTLEFVSPEFYRQNIVIIKHLEAHDPWLMGNPDLLKQVLLNILLNAAQSMPNGGTVTFSVQNINRDDGQPTLRISICDTGSGIAAEHLRQIFDPFFTKKPGGTGLGLAIAKKIISAHKGSIGVVSTLGKGSEFRITLPQKVEEENDGDDRTRR